MTPKKEIFTGIYIWEVIAGNPNRIGDKYVGQALNLNKRGIRHASELKHNKHFNLKLQRYYNKYGKDSLKFYILHTCLLSELDFYETFWIECFDSIKHGFNHTKGGHSRSEKSKKKCTFKNMLTGEEVTYNSLTEFADQYGFTSGSVCNTVNGKNKTLGDWYCPDKYKPKYYTVISPSGENFTFAYPLLPDFCREHNIDRKQLNRLIKGKLSSTRGWTYPDGTHNTVGVDFFFIHDNGEIIKGRNISRFARKYGLNGAILSLVRAKKVNKHKGWKLYQG